MRNYATAQNIGGREIQCDATAVRTAPNGTRAYALLDGIGTSDEVRDWTRRAAAQVAQAAAHRADAEAGLRAVYRRYAADELRQDRYMRQYMPSACALVAATTPGSDRLTVAWCGDVRAYLLVDGTLQRLTEDHNMRRLFPDGGSRHLVTTYLGAPYTDEEAKSQCGHPAIEATERRVTHARLLLACDGAYEPHEDTGADIAQLLGGTPLQAARRVVADAVAAASVLTNRPDNSTALVADLQV
ncbi:mucin-2 [Streptomyces sp. KAU_LT]|uniref:mucin-2 n=1 Tax=Streptomyces sp. KAU_LT TaxID=3046669 RepID=UPI0024B68CA5|nr:mucin-2 [Streptomyces sp. KAU_LT]MDI9829724.1 mucin-2 [Streptomyces sp. KAU_LT]